MSTRYPIKETVKVLEITKPGQKIRFQIRHPENVHAITGILVTSTFVPTRTKIRFAFSVRSKESPQLNNSAGHLSLAIPARGDVIYSEDIQAHNTFTDSLEMIVYGGLVFRDFARSGKRLTYFETEYLIKDAILEGYYEDKLYSQFIRSKEEMETEVLYKVSVYIRYQTTKQS